MICPNCRKPFYFLTRPSPGKARCHRCGFSGEASTPSYDSYHETLYLSEHYVRNQTTDPQMKWILKMLDIRPGDKVVDMGCGVGDYTKAMALLTGDTAGFDLNVDAARKKYPGLQFFQANLNQRFPIEDCSVDKVVSVNTIEHLADWVLFLEETRRILKPGGLVALSTANKSFILHNLHYDSTHLHEWTVKEFERITAPYFQKIFIRKDCAMFKYYPWNFFFCPWLKPDITFIGKR